MRTRPPREASGSSGRAYGQYGTRCCCSDCQRCSCCGWPNGGSSGCCSRNHRAGPGDRGTVRPPGRGKPPVPEEGVAQTPRVGMLGVGNPGSESLFYLPAWKSVHRRHQPQQKAVMGFECRPGLPRPVPEGGIGRGTLGGRRIIHPSTVPRPENLTRGHRPLDPQR